MLFFSQALNIGVVKVILILFVGLMIYLGGAHRKGIVIALFSVGLANLTTDFFKHSFPMVRPFKDPGIANEVILRIGQKTDDVGFGTASAHSANMAAVATVLWLALGWRWGLAWTIIALITGISRIYNGVHFPYQVGLGWTTGILSGLLLSFLASRLRKPDSDPTPTAGLPD